MADGWRSKATPVRSWTDTLYENVIGSGAVDTPGERLGELFRGGTAAVARGMADVPAAPAGIAQLATMGVEKLSGMPLGSSAASRAIQSLPSTREMLASIPVIGPESRYIAPGAAGEYIATGGEFAGGAGLSSGPRAMLRYGVAPGIASEAAGQAVQGTEYEQYDPYLRTLAAIAAPAIAGKITSPLGGADPELLAAAERARALGLNPSAGQTTGSPRLQALEDTLTATPEQLDTLARLAMGTVGSSAPRASQSALREAQSALSTKFDDILGGVEAVPDQNIAQRAMSVVDNYLQDAPASAAIPRVRNVANEIIDAATSPNPTPISLETFRKWRTSLGSLATSDLEADRIAARELRDVIDAATDVALIAAGRASDIPKLAETRKQWWNLIGLKDVASRAGQEARLGRMTPEALRAAVRRTQGPEAISMGRGTNLAELATTAEAAIPSAASVSPGGVRSVAPEVAATGLAGLAGGGVPGMIAAPLATSLGRQFLMNDVVQRYLRNQAAGPTTRSGMIGVVPGLLAQ